MAKLTKCGPLVLLTIGCALGAGLGEIYFRTAAPRPRAQIVSNTSRELIQWDVEGVPLWRQRGVSDSAYSSCNKRPHIAFAGDSIFRIVDDRDPAHLFPAIIASRLEDSGRRACIENVSQSGYLPYQQWMEAKLVHNYRRIDILVFGVWKTGDRYSRLGRDLFVMPGVELDVLGFPISWLPVPSKLHRLLFINSKLYQAVALATTIPTRGDRQPYRIYENVASWAKQEGIHVVFVEFPPLNQPFEASLHERGLSESPFPALAQNVKALGHTYVSVASLLQGHSVERLRLDTCCHYNQLGHSEVAHGLLPAITSVLDSL